MMRWVNGLMVLMVMSASWCGGGQDVKPKKEGPPVTFPQFDLSTAEARLVGKPTKKGYTFTLTNTGKKSIQAKVELVDAPNGYISLALPWRKGKGQEDVLNTAGPGSKFTHSEKLTVPAGKSASCSFPIDCPNWNPYNRYPLTCRLTVGDQVSTQKREIVGKKAKGVFLGQPRNSKDIKESSIGVQYPWEHGALPKCLPMVAEAGIKWNRGSVRWFKIKNTPQGKKPVGLHKRSIKYLEDLKANGINLISSDCIANYETPEAAYTFFKGVAEVLKPYGVNHFEIGNEPQGRMAAKWGGNWNGVTDDKKIAPWVYKFVEFVNAAAKGIKEVHPEAVVIAGAGLNSTAFRAIQVGLSKDVDGVSDHPYPYSITPELVPWGGEHCFKRDGYISADEDHTFLSQMRRLKEEAIKAGRPDMQIWLTEWGIPTHQYDGQTRFSKEELDKTSFNVIEMGNQRISIYEGHTLDTQAKYLARRLIETLSIPDIVTKNFYFCFNRGPWFDKRHWEMGGFSMTRTQDGSPKPSYYAMQRITGLFSDGVKPVDIKVDVPLDRKQGRTGAAWKRPYGSNPALWEGVVPMNELTTPRKHAFQTPEGELMIAVWMPVRAEDWREPDFCDISLNVTGIEYPIAINILTGERSDLEWKEDKEKGITILKSVTVPDSPVVIKMFPRKEGMKITGIKKIKKTTGKRSVAGTYIDANTKNTTAVDGKAKWLAKKEPKPGRKDNLWFERKGIYDGVCEGEGVLELMGDESRPIITTITGLTPGAKYEVRIAFLTATGMVAPQPDWNVKAGFAPARLGGFGRGNSNMTGKSMAGEKGTILSRSQALIGTTTAEADGTIHVYVSGYGRGDPEASRALYDGVSYKPVGK